MGRCIWYENKENSLSKVFYRILKPEILLLVKDILYRKWFWKFPKNVDLIKNLSFRINIITQYVNAINIPKHRQCILCTTDMRYHKCDVLVKRAIVMSSINA
jgi:hypothetical protein